MQKDVKGELQFFHENGGRSIVDATTIGIGRNLTELVELSKESGVNIIAGAGKSECSSAHYTCMG